MISLSYNVRVSPRQDFRPSPLLSYLNPLASRPLEVFTSPVAEYSLSLEDLNQRIVVPFNGSREINLDGHTIPFSAIERIEIRAAGIDQDILPLHKIFGRLGSFESSGADVSTEFIKSTSQFGPSIGSPERPDAIPPDLLFDRLVTNERLRKATIGRFRSRNFTDAVEAAFKCLANSVKEVSGHNERDGADLMRHVFGAQSPLLRLNALQSRSDKDEHNGYRDIFAGAMTGIRNPRAHEHESKDNLVIALELLTMANHLMRKLDGATKNDTPSEDSTP